MFSLKGACPLGGPLWFGKCPKVKPDPKGFPKGFLTRKVFSIRELAETVQRVVGFEGELGFDATKPDGTPRKLQDVSRMEALGWRARIGLEVGIRGTYEWYQTYIGGKFS